MGSPDGPGADRIATAESAQQQQQQQQQQQTSRQEATQRGPVRLERSR